MEPFRRHDPPKCTQAEFDPPKCTEAEIDPPKGRFSFQLDRMAGLQLSPHFQQKSSAEVFATGLRPQPADLLRVNEEVPGANGQRWQGML
jgi:hypothetical protein